MTKILLVMGLKSNRIETYVKVMCLVGSLLFAVPSIGVNDSTRIPLPSHAKETISRDQYVWGGTVGTILGFGIGHAIQGRYKEKGWIFTLTEGIGAGTIASGIIWTLFSYKESSKTGDASVGDVMPFVGLGLLGATIILGFRIWEIVDLWSVDHANDGYSR